MGVGKCCFRPQSCSRNCHLRNAPDPSLHEEAGSAGTAPAYSDTKPSYYNAGPGDLIAFALSNSIGAMEFTIMKYVMRWRGKDGLRDLRKAREYLDRLIEHETKLAKELADRLIEPETKLAKERAGVSSNGDTNG